MPPLSDLPVPGEKFIVLDRGYDEAFGPYDSEDAAKIGAYDLGRDGFLSDYDNVTIARIRKPVT